MSALLVAGASPGMAQQAPNVAAALENTQTTLAIRADSQEKIKETYHLKGHVEVAYQEMKLTADEADIDNSSGDVAARGHVVFTDPQAHLEATEANYNVHSGKGWFANAHGHLHAKVHPRPRMLVTENLFYVRARRVDRQDESHYTITAGRASSCEHERRGWSVSAHRARVEVGNKVVTHGALFRMMRVPAFYSPILVNSIADNPRRSGFLMPHVGTSTQKGVILGGGFYWAINPSADLLLGAENYSVRGLGRRGLFRANPTASSVMLIEYYGVSDKGGGPSRQLRAPGESLRVSAQAKDLGLGFRGVLDVDYITSLAFRFTFTENFVEAVASEARQTGFLSKNFGPYSLNISASRYQEFLSAERKPGNSIIIRQTPSASLAGMDHPVGRSPFYFAFEASAAGMGRTEPGFETPQISERVDFHPALTLRSRPVLGFHFTPSASIRATHYGTSLNASGSPLTRLLGEVWFDLRPPSLAKVFSWGEATRRFKHVIEPNIRYRRVRAVDREGIKEIVRFDEADILSETNEVEYSLTNSLLTRREASEGAAANPQARELISLRVSQKYYLDPTFGGALEPGKKVVFDPAISLTGFAFAQGRRLSPLVTVLKLAPSSNYDTELRADFNPSGGGVLNAGVTSNLRRGRVGLGLAEFFINRTALLSQPLPPATPLSSLQSFNLLRAVVTYGDFHRKGLSGAFGTAYNFTQGIAHQAVSQVSYNFGCFALDFEFLRLALGPLRRDHQFRVALSLANVGTFGNLKPRERLY